MTAKLTTMNSAKSRANYFERDGYYAKNDPEHRKASLWYGLGSEELGLRNTVSPAKFESVLEGHVPGQDLRLGRIVDGEHVHRPGYDLTLSVPKSVSMEGLLYNRKPVIDAYNRAVAATLDWAEANFVDTRVWNRETKRMERQQTGRMVAALFRHDTSRNLDPHLHTHCVVANMTRAGDGKWRGVERTGLLRHERLIGAYFHNEMARNLIELGYDIRLRQTTGMPTFEIAGYRNEDLDRFSSRRKEILDYIKKMGWSYNSRTAQVAALATRPKKVEVDRAELRAECQSQVAELGLKSPWTKEALRESRKAREAAGERESPNLLAAARLALEDIESRRSVFAAADLKARMMAQYPGRTSIGEVEATIKGMERDGHLIAIEKRGADGGYVTAQMLQAERDIVAHVRDGRGKVEALVPGFDSGALKRDGIELTKGQADAVAMVLGSKDRVVGVQGYAGTGKTTMLRTLEEKLEGRTVMGLAPTRAAVRALGTEAGIPSGTLQRFLVEYGKVPAMEGAELDELRAKFKDTVMVLDEASMVGTRQMKSLFEITRRLRIDKLVLVGDDRQLRSVEAGRPFGQLQENGMATAVMQDVVRQKDDRIRAAVLDAMRGAPGAALERLGGDVVESDDPARKAAGIWLGLDPEARDGTMVLIPTHAMRAEANAAIRMGLKGEGALGGKEHECTRLVNKGMTPGQKAEANHHEPGDVLVFHQDARNYRIRKGDHYTVTDMSEDGRVHLRNDAGEERHIKPSKDPRKGSVRYRYDVYTPREIDLMAGDSVRFTRNDDDAGTANGGMGTIEAINERKVKIRKEDGGLLELARDHDAMKHIDHGYTATVHAAQGRTTDHVIAVLDSGIGPLANQQAFYVEISRARQGVTVITDNLPDLAVTLEENTGERMTAMEAVGEGGKSRIAVPEPVKSLDGPELDQPDLSVPIILEHAMHGIGGEGFVPVVGRRQGKGDVGMPHPAHTPAAEPVQVQEQAVEHGQGLGPGMDTEVEGTGMDRADQSAASNKERNREQDRAWGEEWSQDRERERQEELERQREQERKQRLEQQRAHQREIQRQKDAEHRQREQAMKREQERQRELARKKEQSQQSGKDQKPEKERGKGRGRGRGRGRGPGLGGGGMSM